MVAPLGWRVVIVDDDVWIRAGRAAALQSAGVEVVGVLDHAAAAAAGEEVWSMADIALVDAWDRQAGFDRFPGVAVVEAIRRQRSRTQTHIVIVTGHVFNELLRRRMLQAGADSIYSHDDVADLPALLDALRHQPDRGPRPETAASGGNPNAALAWVKATGNEGPFIGESQKALNTPRRAIMRIRNEVGERAGLPAHDGSRVASWKKVVEYVNRARGAGRD